MIGIFFIFFSKTKCKRKTNLTKGFYENIKEERNNLDEGKCDIYIYIYTQGERLVCDGE